MSAGPLLLDFGPVSDCCTDAALESLHKAAGDPQGDDPSIWRPHESALIRDLLEKFSDAGLEKLAALKADVEAWMAGARHVPGLKLPPKPDLPVQYPWASEQVLAVEKFLAAKPLAEWYAEDWQALVDMLVQKHLPTALLAKDAERYVVQCYSMGGVQAVHGELPAGAAATLAGGLPKTVGALVHSAGLAPWQRSVLDYAKLRCAENVVALTDANRIALRRVILNHQERRFLGDQTATVEQLQQQLFDHFGSWNRDWRRIAVTEAGENLNQGVIAGLVPGTLVKRLEMYVGACAYCKKIDGRVLKVVSPDAKDKDGENEVWVGKTNIGRSASPRKRVGGQLIDRLPSERWWPAAGVIHPHCRGRWTVLAETPEKDILPGA